MSFFVGTARVERVDFARRPCVFNSARMNLGNRSCSVVMRTPS
jgi:hypothetical protein